MPDAEKPLNEYIAMRKRGTCGLCQRRRLLQRNWAGSGRPPAPIDNLMVCRPCYGP